MATDAVLPPTAPRRAHSTTHHGDTRTDNYFWLRDDDREDPDVIHYLNAENRYCEQVMVPIAGLRESLYSEMVARLPKKESTVPWRKNGYRYRQVYDDGNEYPVWQRQPVAGEPSQWSVLLDGNQRACEHPFYDVGALAVSPDNRWLAVTEDTVSRRQYQLQFRDLECDGWSDEKVENTSGSVVWGNDSLTVYYVRKHPVTLLPYQVWRHRLGVSTVDDELVYEESDNSFYVGIYKSRSEDFVVIALGSTTTSDALLLDANDPKAIPQRFVPRRHQHEYNLDHFDGYFWLRSNKDGKNFALYRTVTPVEEALWSVVAPPSTDIMIEDFLLFNDHIVLEEREQGLTQLRIVERLSGKSERVLFNDSAWVVWTGTNPEPDSPWLRFCYTSMTMPYTVFELNCVTGERRQLKQEEVHGFTPEHYQSARIEITARDGVNVPVSLVWHREHFQPGTNPLMVYGYGAYGESIDADFSSTRLSLLDRGFVCAIAHIRGGGELGQQWYEAGKLAHKQNTFNDFIDVCNALLAQEYGDPARLYAMGGSAGGLLMGAVINQAPTLFHGVLAQVPFVDALTTMLDDTLPLTTGEYDEWGNPGIAADYFAIKQWSPYDQVAPQTYPHMLVTTGLHDSQVQYWEPAKWVAKLREVKTGDNLLLLWTDMDTGHGGKSGRYQYYETVAMEYAFLVALSTGQLP